MGAGWHREEFDWIDVLFLPHSKRLSQTEEGLQLLRSYWTENVITFQGTYYQVDDVTCEPKPMQQPHPPFLLGEVRFGCLN
ncbi:MAG: LLM class flavin-dependent oxidoreductase [Promethearchaeota archaeon]